jgi:hypothetical protein
MNISTALRAVIALLALAALPFTASAQSQIRAVHLSPDAPSIDIYINGSSTPTAAGLGFGGASSVVTVPPGTVRMKVTLGGLPQLVIFDADVNVPESTRIDVLALNRITSPEASTITLPLGTSTSPDSSYLRLVAASPDAPPLDMTIIDTAGVPHSFSDIDFKSQTPFFAIPKGRFIAEVRSGTTLLLRAAGTVPPGEHGTIFAAGLLADLKLRLLNETQSAQQIPMQVLEPAAVPAPTHIRFVNVLPDSLGGAPATAGLVIGGTSLFDGVTPRSATAIALHDGGSFPLALAIQGTTTTTIATQLSPDSVYSFILFDPAIASLATLARSAGVKVPHDSTLVRIVDGIGSFAPLIFTARTSGPLRLRETMNAREISDAQMLPAGLLDLLVASSGGDPMYRGSAALPGGSIVTVITSHDTWDLTHAYILIESDSAAQIPMRELASARRAGLRLVNGAPGFDSLDISFTDDDAHHITISPLSATPITDDLLGGPLGITARWNYRDQGQPRGATAEVTIPLPQDTLTTLVAVQTGKGDSITFLRLHTTEAATPAIGRTTLRVLHASPQSPALDLVFHFADGTTTTRYDSLIYGDVTPYGDIPPGKTTMDIYVRGDPRPLPLSTVTIRAEQAVTVVIADLFVPGTPVIPERDNRVTMHAYLLIDSDEREQIPLLPFSMAAGVETATTGNAALSLAPNPSRGEVTITCTLARRGRLAISLYDMLGRPALRLDDGILDAGVHTVIVPAGTLPAGVYSVVLGGSTGASARLVLVR